MRPVSVNTIELPASPVRGQDQVAEPASAQSFTASLQAAVAKVDALQTDADAETARMAGGAGNLHETMLALEKADVGMRVAMKVRNKILDAYNDVMRMSV
jgi:flagellar hook-basal body complex protein FliE